MIEVRRRLQRVGDKGSRPAFDPQVFRSRYLQLTRFDQLPTYRIEALGRVVLSGKPELEAAWRMTQHLYGIHVAADTDEANQALGAFIEVWSGKAQASTSSTSWSEPSSNGERRSSTSTTPNASPTG